VSKSAQVENEDGEVEYHWVSSLSSTGWKCMILTQMWAYTSPDAIIIPLLCHEAIPLPQHAPEFVGVDFEALPPDTANDTAPGHDALLEASVVFEPEVSTLPKALQSAHTAFYRLYKEIDGVELSATGKDEMGRAGDMELIYGEVQLVPFWQVLEAAVNPQPGEVFIDLGSGTGRAVVAAALRFTHLQTCIGYEVVPTLHQAAEFVKQQLATEASAPLEFRCTDFREHSWESTADIVWVSSLCMSEATLQDIRSRCTRLKPGARIVTMDSCFSDDSPGAFEAVVINGSSRIEVEMSFGDAGVYAFRVKGDAGLFSMD